jgi:Carboxypeptidase regulatory-like domain/TonB dependent receptor-like, beta-barrel/TonB-dependent Receptor Plug Domain
MLQAGDSHACPRKVFLSSNLPSNLLIFLWLLHYAVIGGVARLAAQTTSAVEGMVTDTQNLAVSGARITLRNPASDAPITVESDAAGNYRFAGLRAGTYNLEVAKAGFATGDYDGLNVTMNQSLVLNLKLTVGKVRETVTVSAKPLLIDPYRSSSGATILPLQIRDMPINGRNYLDLMQLVPGVTVNRQRDSGTDAATPILGERGGNATFLIDGMPNSNGVDGGPAAQFEQDSILEFQVLTAGYRAEFGHGSGGVVNVVTRSGTDQWHGLLSAFHRNGAFDSSDIPGLTAPFLVRWDTDADAGGPILKDHAFVFGSLERIRESRQLNFIFPPATPDFLEQREETYDQPNRTFETRGFLKFDESIGRHHVTEEANLVNSDVTNFLPLSEAIDLPSTRTDSHARYLMLGIHDTATLGERGNPFLVDAYFQYRGEPSSEFPAHPEASPATTLFNIFSSLNTGGLFGDLDQVEFGAGFSPLVLQPQYTSFGLNADKAEGRHGLKFGWDFQRTRVNGTEATNLLDQLFATASDFEQYGPVDSGVYVLTRVGGMTPEDNLIRLRNNYNGLFVQDDWKMRGNLTANLGLRWDYDSRFPNLANLAPRLGLAWSPTPKTVVEASWGVFYDHYRLGLAQDVPGLGGANLFTDETISFPRLFYGDPTSLPQLEGLCPSPVLTDAQIQATGATCPAPGLPVFGVDHLNSVVAPGHSPVAPGSVVTEQNVQALTGLTPSAFADAASAAVGKQPGYFFWGGFGNLSMNFLVPQIFSVPVTVAPGFKTPYTSGFHVGLQREISDDAVIQADYFHRDIRNILGVRTANLAFQARLPGHTGELQPGTGNRPILSYGPWFQGRYDSISVGLRKQMGKRLASDVSYTWTNAVDNDLNSDLVSEVQTGLGAGSMGMLGPTDSFIGVPPVVTDPVTGQSNAKGPFIASNGNPVPQAGKFYYGPNLDRGPSDLALDQTFFADEVVRLPWHFEISGIFRAQSGFHFTDVLNKPVDVDGDGIFNGVDFFTGRNRYEAPPFINLDMRLSKSFTVRDRLRIETLFEFFNLLNRANPAAVEQYQSMPTPLGQPLQYLPGREGQVAIRLEF